MPFSATSAARGSTDRAWRIEQECPQCGAPVTLSETDRLLVCDFCRVRLILATNQTVRTLLPPRDPSPDGLVFVPYWRLKGQVWPFGRNHLRPAIVDMTRRAVALEGLPLSLGVRPQAMKLRFVTAETPGRFARSGIPLDAAVAAFWKSRDELVDDGAVDRLLLGETVGLIYVPVRIRDGLEDAVLDRTIASRPEEEIEIEPADEFKRACAVRFLSTVCPNCGSDLQAERDSLVLVCPACRTAWNARDTALERVSFQVLPAAFEPEIYIPFWKSCARVDGEAASFWTPAFKLHPEHWLRLARTLTIQQPRGAADELAPTGEVYPVTLPARGVADSLRILLTEIGGARRLIRSPIDAIRTDEATSTLVYVPMQSTANEISHPEMPIAFSRNLLAFGRNL